MDDNSIKFKIDSLRAEIARHEKLYRIHNAPVISDDEFDLLMRELRELEALYPQYYDPNSPSLNVGNDLSGDFKSVKHLSPMLSLDNVFNSAELEEFDSRLKKVLGIESQLKYCVEPKIDGCGISAVYENGKLVRLLTRGDGEKGDDITRNAFLIKNIPMVLSGGESGVPSLLEVRGEAYMENSEFERIYKLQRESLIEKALEKKIKESSSGLLGGNDSSCDKPVSLSDGELAEIEKKLPANPRNLTAGTMKLLPKSFDKNPILKSRSLKAVFYSIGSMDGIVLQRQSDLPKLLKSWGLPAVNWYELADGAGGAFEKICALEEIRADFPYNTDGAVVKLDDCSLHSVAGMTAHAPRWAVAWKYRAQRAQTRLNAITLQVGRTGVITPVAELESIKNLSGTTVSRATLHNAGYISQKDIRVGDTVIVEKAGEIIPAVLGVVAEKRPADAKPYVFPEFCPECGSPLRRFGEKMLHRCPNLSCPPQVVGRLAHFASRGCMDIRGLGDKVAQSLVDELGIKTPADIYDLTKERLLSLPKFKDKSAENLIEAIKSSKGRDLWRLIFGLGILEIGERFAKELARKFGNLDALMNASLDDIKSLDDFGSKSVRKKDGEIEEPVRALSIKAFFEDPHNRALIERLREHGVNFKSLSSQDTVLETPFSGKTFAITGTLKSMGRDAAKFAIEGFGGKVVSSVSSSTDFLISDGKERGAKAKKAEELGTPILDEDAFLEMLEAARTAGEIGSRAAGSGESGVSAISPEGAGEDLFKSASCGGGQIKVSGVSIETLGETGSPSAPAHSGGEILAADKSNPKKNDYDSGSPQMELPL